MMFSHSEPGPGCPAHGGYEGLDAVVGVGQDLVPGLLGFGGLEGNLSRPLHQAKRCQVPAGTPCRARLAVAAVVLDVVALEHGRGGLNHQRLTVVLPGAGFEIERGAVDGIQLGAVVLAVEPHLAQRLPDVLASNVEGGHGG